MVGGQRRLNAVPGPRPPATATATSPAIPLTRPTAWARDAGLTGLDDVLARVARGDERAFEQLYDAVAGQVHGLVRRVLRDPAQAEEVTQEVFLEIWRTATRFDPTRGKAKTWIMTMAHARAVDRVRSAQASSDRDLKVGTRDYSAAYDEVSETVETRLERVQVRAAWAA